MEISDLLGKLKGTDKDKPQPFLALELTDEIVVAAVWQVSEGQTAIVSVGTPVEWNGDKEDADELVTAADATVSNAIEGLEVEPTQIIFGVSPSWAGDNGILPAKITLIKKICKELELKPLGFVVITDSLLRYLKMQEGIPANSIFVHVARDIVTVTLVRMGKIEASEAIGRGDDLASDVVEGLSRFAAGAELPSRILVYDGMHNIEEEVQNLLSFDWKSTFNFLHIPKIETLPKDVVIRSIAVAGGAEVAKAIGFDIAEPQTTTHESSMPGEEVKGDEQPQDDTDIENVTAVDDQILSAADFGFAKPETEIHKKLPPAPIPTRVNLLDEEGEEETGTSELDDGHTEDETQEPLPKASVTDKRNIKAPSIKLPKLTLPHFHVPSFGKTGLVLGVIAMLLVIGGAAGIWLVPKATVTVFVEPKTLPETTTLTLDTQAQTVEVGRSIVPAVPVEKVVTGEDTIPVTGKKIIGDPAKGEVTVYNRTSLTKTFKAGTVLTAKSLKFTLDNDVTIASKSANADYVDVPGKATVKVTAKAIGTESNLAADTELTIESFAKDTYVARNSTALTGGSSREVQVVDKADKANLSKALLSKLKDQGRAELISELGGAGVYVMEKGSSIEEEEYSPAIGTEATELVGSMSVKVKGVSYSPKDVETLMASTLGSAIPGGYTRTDDIPSVELGEVKSETDATVEIAAKITVKLLPQVDTSIVRDALRGLAPNEVEGALTGVMGLKGAEVTITPKWLSPQFKRMPRNPSNIAVNVVPAV